MPRIVTTLIGWTISKRSSLEVEISSALSCALNTSVRLRVVSVSPSSTTAVPYALPPRLKETSRAYGNAALARVVYPGCECKSNAAPERTRTGMCPRGASRSTTTVFDSFPVVEGGFCCFTMAWEYQSRQMTCPRPGRIPVSCVSGKKK